MEEEKAKEDGGIIKGKVLTLFLIGFPTILVIALGILTHKGISAFSWVFDPVTWIQILVVFYQFVMLKQFLDRYYEVL